MWHWRIYRFSPPLLNAIRIIGSGWRVNIPFKASWIYTVWRNEQIHGARLWLSEWEIWYSHCNLISSPFSWTVTVSVTWALVWMDGQRLTFSLETEKELIFSHLDWTVIVIPSHWNLLFKYFISYNVSSNFHRSDKTWSVTWEFLTGAKVHIPPSCSQQELVRHSQWLIREVWDSDSFRRSHIRGNRHDGWSQASASHLVHSLQPDHLWRDTWFKSPRETPPEQRLFQHGPQGSLKMLRLIAFDTNCISFSCTSGVGFP